MKFNIWTYFVNGIAIVCAIIGIASMASTYQLFDNYNIAKDDYRFFNAYNTYNKSLSSGMATDEKDELSKLLNSKYQNIGYKFDLDTISTFTSFDSYLTYLKDKDKSFIYSENAISIMKSNIEAIKNNNFGELEAVKNTIKAHYDSSTGKYTNDYYRELDIYVYRNFTNIYAYNKTPEQYSMIFGILFLTGGVVTTISYFSWFIYKMYKKIKVN